jgi:hypothetical protein
MKANKVGECDACPKTEVELYISGKMVLCLNCFNAESAAIADNDAKLTSVIETSRKIDAGVTVSTDVFNAATVAFIELQTAIAQDAAIPADKKNEVLVKTVEERIRHYNEVIFAEEAATLAKKNERYSWSKQIQEFVGKMRTEEREKYKKYNLSYTPAPVVIKSVKPASPKKSGTKTAFNLKACKEAAAKYGVDYVGVQSMVLSKNMTYDDAAKQLAAIIAAAAGQ